MGNAKCIVSDNDGHNYLIDWDLKDKFYELRDKNGDEWTNKDWDWMDKYAARIDSPSNIKILDYEGV